jgi:hypothetical protein
MTLLLAGMLSNRDGQLNISIWDCSMLHQPTHVGLHSLLSRRSA